MNKERRDQMSFEALVKYEKLIEITTIIMIVAVPIIVICGVYLTVKQGFSTFTVTPLLFVPMLILQLAKLKRIQAEVEGRSRAL